TAAVLLLARREELRIAREIRLRIAGAEGRLLAAALAALHRRRRALVVALVERLVLHVVAAMRVVAGRVLGPIEIRLVLAELLLHGRDHAEIVLGVLIVVFGGHRIAGRLGVARELHVLLRDMVRGAANFDVRAVRLVDPRQRIVALAAVTPPHALVLTVPHGSLVCQPLCFGGLTPRMDSDENANRPSRRAATAPSRPTTQ